MRIGITGHQDRPEIDWAWVATAIGGELAKRSPVEQALSSLAAGADQVFARAALEIGIPVLGVIPIGNYADFFEGIAREAYAELLVRCELLDLGCVGDAERCFFEAGKEIVRRCDVVFAVWDGKPAKGVGGTADVVSFARKEAKTIVHFDPVVRKISVL